MRVLLCACALVLACATPSFASPASTNVRGAEYPAINADRSITFQFAAPTAQKVQVQPGDVQAGKQRENAQPLTSNAAGAV